MKGGYIKTTLDIASQQFIFQYSLDGMTPIYFLRYETLLAYRPCDEARIEISPKQVLRLNYFHETIHQDLTSASIVCTSWEGERVIILRIWITTSEEARLVVTVHDISGSGPSDITVTPNQVCPDEDILMNIPRNILEDNGGYHIQHVGFSGKAIVWLTTDLTLMMLEVPPPKGLETNHDIPRTRSWRIPSSVGLEHHGEVRNIYLEDSRGRVILAMQDETLIIFEFA